MVNSHLKQFFFAVCLFLLASIAVLWAWNTLSELFHWPLAHYRHVIAVFILLLIVKWSVSGYQGVFYPLLKHRPDHTC